METKIVLQVQGVDLDDFDQMEAMATHLEDLGWESAGGIVTVTLYTDSAEPVAAALEAAHSIEQVLPGSKVVRADEQLVSVGDIADRLGLSSEAVRLWSTRQRRTTSRPFPSPRAVVSQARTAMKLWAWTEVSGWLRSEYRLDPEPGVRYLSGEEAARLSAELGRPTPGSPRWRTVIGSGCDRMLARMDEDLASNRTRFSTAKVT